MIRAPAEADAPARLDNEGPATTYLSVTVFPAVTSSPRGTGEAPRCAGGGFSMRAILMQRIVCSNKVQKRAGVGPRRSFSLTGDYRVARAAYEEAVRRRPGRIVTLRQKTRLLADSRRKN
jgi:hypothetical protein